ncbi:MAG: hypothetical protein OXR07_00665 [Nitrospira sp.]|nr:hypothetical protein [Nitrospira sp.]MDD9858925.1 hypothetical protein [Nitrospira sp.]
MQDLSPCNVDPAERITRYILDKRYFNPETGKITVKAFLPHTPKLPGSPEIQTSVYRTMDCEETEIWSIGDDYVANPKAKPKRFVLARGDLEAETVFSQDLKIVPHPTPHKRHANIVNWPTEGNRELQEMKAVELAKKARLVTR